METNSSTRREFITTTVTAGTAITVGLSAISSILPSCTSTKAAAGTSKFNTGFSQDRLPYSYSALDRAIDATTMEIHYTKHAAGYASNLQDAAKAEGVDTGEPVENLLARISKYSTKMRNNAGGHYNHELFWKSMGPNTPDNPSGKLLAAIEQRFNTFESFKNQFGEEAKSRFGSGWAWLYLDNDKRWQIGSTPNQDNPLMNISDVKGFPLLGLDVWEHAYYLRYQNKRADYINNWWKVVNWKYVQDRFEAGM
jgi:Fe-Mn family superoxide dismutase